MNEHPIYDQVRRLRYDLTAMQAKVTDLLTELARLEMPKPSAGHRCPYGHCGIEHKTAERLADHLALIHDVAPIDVAPSDLDDDGRAHGY